MRHKKMCHQHLGHIANCQSCHREFTVNEIVANALAIHCGKGSKTFLFSDQSVKRLDKFVYELQKDHSWPNSDAKSKAVRYFASNALVNAHYVTHTSRCFKKGDECYANLPDAACNSGTIQYNENPDTWFDWCGNKEQRYMFAFRPKRNPEDAFMNTHNMYLTTLLGCNNNLMVGMNDRAVFM